MAANPVVQVTDLRKTYGVDGPKPYEALKGISFDVAPGEFIGIMGASGSGKTTLLNILATLDDATSGSVTINQRPVASLKGDQLADFRAKEVGFIFQDFNLLENLTVEENIALPLSLQNQHGRAADRAVRAVAQELSIDELLPKYPTEISGGQKQRVAAARALVANPAILFGDEPTGALDSSSARDLLDLLTQVNRDRQVSILLVTHDPFSASYCQRILFIKDGQIGSELRADGMSRPEFYQQILDSLGTFNM